MPPRFGGRAAPLHHKKRGGADESHHRLLRDAAEGRMIQALRVQGRGPERPRPSPRGKSLTIERRRAGPLLPTPLDDLPHAGDRISALFFREQSVGVPTMFGCRGVPPRSPCHTSDVFEGILHTEIACASLVAASVCLTNLPPPRGSACDVVKHSAAPDLAESRARPYLSKFAQGRWG